MCASASPPVRATERQMGRERHGRRPRSDRGRLWLAAGAVACAVAACRGDDRAVLMELFNATGGPGWTRSDNWGSAHDICTWYGVTQCGDSGSASCAVTPSCQCSSCPPDTVAMLDLGGNNLAGGSGLVALGAHAYVFLIRPRASSRVRVFLRVRVCALFIHYIETVCLVTTEPNTSAWLCICM